MGGAVPECSTIAFPACRRVLYLASQRWYVYVIFYIRPPRVSVVPECSTVAFPACRRVLNFASQRCCVTVIFASMRWCGDWIFYRCLSSVPQSSIFGDGVPQCLSRASQNWCGTALSYSCPPRGDVAAMFYLRPPKGAGCQNVLGLPGVMCYLIVVLFASQR